MDGHLGGHGSLSQQPIVNQLQAQMRASGGLTNANLLNRQASPNSSIGSHQFNPNPHNAANILSAHFNNLKSTNLKPLSQLNNNNNNNHHLNAASVVGGVNSTNNSLLNSQLTQQLIQQQQQQQQQQMQPHQLPTSLQHHQQQQIQQQQLQQNNLLSLSAAQNSSRNDLQIKIPYNRNNQVWALLFF
jgi:hypothetical protein